MSVSSIEQFRQAALTEAGMTVSAGARVAHVRLAMESGRAVTVDLSQVPEERRSALVAVIREMVRLTEVKAESTELPEQTTPAPSAKS